MYQSGLKNYVSMVHEKKMENRCSKYAFDTFYKCKVKEHARVVFDKIIDKAFHMCDARLAKTENLRVYIQSMHDKTENFRCSLCIGFELLEPKKGTFGPINAANHGKMRSCTKVWERRSKIFGTPSARQMWRNVHVFGVFGAKNRGRGPIFVAEIPLLGG